MCNYAGISVFFAIFCRTVSYHLTDLAVFERVQLEQGQELELALEQELDSMKTNY